MIFEVIKEITVSEVLLYMIPVFLLVLVMLIMGIYMLISNIKHKSYHKGYAEARTKEFSYYKTLRKLNEYFDLLTEKIQENDINLNFETAELLLKYKNKLEYYRTK